MNPASQGDRKCEKQRAAEDSSPIGSPTSSSSASAVFSRDSSIERAWT